MPLCEGPPNKTMSAQVGFLSQGDLMLCRDCEEVRFPFMTRSQAVARIADRTASQQTLVPN